MTGRAAQACPPCPGLWASHSCSEPCTHAPGRSLRAGGGEALRVRGEALCVGGEALRFHVAHL